MSRSGKEDQAYHTVVAVDVDGVLNSYLMMRDYEVTQSAIDKEKDVIYQIHPNSPQRGQIKIENVSVLKAAFELLDENGILLVPGSQRTIALSEEDLPLQANVMDAFDIAFGKNRKFFTRKQADEIQKKVLQLTKEENRGDKNNLVDKFNQSKVLLLRAAESIFQEEYGELIDRASLVDDNKHLIEAAREQGFGVIQVDADEIYDQKGAKPFFLADIMLAHVNLSDLVRSIVQCQEPIRTTLTLLIVQRAPGFLLQLCKEMARQNPDQLFPFLDSIIMNKPDDAKHPNVDGIVVLYEYAKNKLSQSGVGLNLFQENIDVLRQYIVTAVISDIRHQIGLENNISLTEKFQIALSFVERFIKNSNDPELIARFQDAFDDYIFQLAADLLKQKNISLFDRQSQIKDCLLTMIQLEKDLSRLIKVFEVLREKPDFSDLFTKQGVNLFSSKSSSPASIEVIGALKNRMLVLAETSSEDSVRRLTASSQSGYKALHYQQSLFGKSLATSEKRLISGMVKRGITLPDDASKEAHDYYASLKTL